MPYLQNEIALVQAAIASAVSESDAARKALENANAATAAAQVDLAQLVRQRESLAQTADTIARVEAEIAAAKEARDRIFEQLGANERAASEARRDRDAKSRDAANRRKRPEELRRAQELVREAEEQLTKVDADISQASRRSPSRLNQLQRRREIIILELAESRKELEDLSAIFAQMARLDAEVAELSSRVEALANTRNSLQTNLNTASLRVNSLDQQLRALAADVQNLRVLAARIDAATSLVASRSEAALAARAMSESRVATAERLTNVGSALTAAVREIDAPSLDRTALQTGAAAVWSRLLETQADLRSRTDALNAAESDSRRLASELPGKRAARDAQADLVAKKRGETQSAADTVARVRGELARAEGERQAAENAIAGLRIALPPFWTGVGSKVPPRYDPTNPHPSMKAWKTWSENFDAARKRLDAAVQAIEAAQRQLPDLELTKSRRAADLAGHERALEAMRTDVSAAESRKAAVDATAARLQTEIAGLDARATEMQTAHDAATARLLGFVPADTPVVLLPIRLECRFSKSAGDDSLLLRIYPDDIHVDSHEPGITAEEHEAGKAYWAAAGTGASSAVAPHAWAALLRQFGRPRAAWIARVTDPNAPIPAKITPAWTREASARVLPDRWAIACISGGIPEVIAWSRNIAEDPLPVGPAPSAAGIDGFATLQKDPAIRWLTDFPTAEQVGMGVRIPLTTAQATRGFDSVVVFGVKARTSSGDDVRFGSIGPSVHGARLRELLDAHRFTRGIAFVEQHAPTNNTHEVRSAWRTSDTDPAASFSTEMGEPLIRSADGSDGGLVAAALGLTPDAFERVFQANLGEQQLAEIMNRAIWNILDTPLLNEFQSSVDVKEVRRHFELWVRGRGTLPVVRAGSQPYGILPVTSLRRWRALPADSDAGIAAVLQRRQTAFAKLAALASSERTASLESLLEQDATSCEYVWKRGGSFATVKRDPSAKSTARSSQYLAALAAADFEALKNDSPWTSVRPEGPVPLAYLLLRQAAMNALDPSRATDPAEVAAFRAALIGLRQLDDTKLARLLSEALDTATFRWDAWATSLAARRLAASRPVRCLGAYGWICDVRPQPDTDSGGYIHAPSLAQATTAAVLRSAWVNERAKGRSGAAYALDLSSARVANALWLLDGVRAGQSLSALLGYRFERLLQENRLGAYIDAFRVLAAIRHEDELSFRMAESRAADLAFNEADEHFQAVEAAFRIAEAEYNTRKSAHDAALAERQLYINRIAQLEGLDSEVVKKDRALQEARSRPLAAFPNVRVDIKGNALFPTAVQVFVPTQQDYATWGAMAGERTNAILQAEADLNRAISDRDTSAGGPGRYGEAVAFMKGLRDNAQEKVDEARKELDAATARLAERNRDSTSATARRSTALTRKEAAARQVSEVLRMQWSTASQSVTAADIVDGLELHRRWKRAQANPPVWDGTTIPYGYAHTGLPPAGSDDQNAIERQLKVLDDLVDSVSDATVAESVHHIVQGNPTRAGATLSAIARGESPPPELEVVRTPRSGLAVTHRVLITFDHRDALSPMAAAWNTGASQARAAADPWLNGWLASLLPDPRNVRCVAVYANRTTGAVLRRVEMGLDALGLSPMDAVCAVGEGSQVARELHDRFRLAALGAKPADVPADSLVSIDSTRQTGWPAETVSLPEFASAAGAIRRLLGNARPLDGRDLLTEDERYESGVDVAEFARRVDMGAAALSASASSLGAVLDVKDAALAAEALLRLAGFGISGCVPTVPPEESELRFEAVESQIRAALGEAQARLAAVDAMKAPAGGSPEDLLAFHLRRLEQIFGPDFRATPQFRARNGEAVEAALASPAAGADAAAVLEWFGRMARVRQGLWNLNLASFQTEALRGALAASRAWLKWYAAQGASVEAGQSGPPPAWNASRMEYAFDAAAELSGAEVVLRAREYLGGEVDWHTFVVDDSARLGSTNATQRMTVQRLPVAVSYRGMPSSRLWEMENGDVNLVAIQTGPEDPARMMTIQFALVHSNDWFVVPIELPAGSVSRVLTLHVTDTFGVTVQCRSTADVDANTPGWAMFRLTRANGGNGDVLFLPRPLGSSLSSAPIEDLLLLRDEMANLGWAIELTVESQLGKPADRSAAVSRRADSDSPVGRRQNAPWKYRLGTNVPQNWFALVPRQASVAGNIEQRLVRGAMPDLVTGSVKPIPPLGRLLGEPAELFIYDEEAPSEGARVTRAWRFARAADGSSHVWIARRKQAGTGPGSSGLRFDVLD